MAKMVQVAKVERNGDDRGLRWREGSKKKGKRKTDPVRRP